MVSYFYERTHLFWTHKEDSYSTFNTVVDFEEMGVVKFEETEFSKGIMLETNSEKFKSVFESEEELFEYVDIYSV